MTKEELVSHVELSVFRANEGITKLPGEVLSIPGMSASCNRILLNELMSAPGLHYLEVGCWKGSTAISALFDNPFNSALLIDNFSEFNDPSPEPELRFNLERFGPHLHGKIILRNEDCFTVYPEESYHVFFYDGNHDEQSQRRAFTHFNVALRDTFVAVVDDWNWNAVRKGTFTAFEELKYRVVHRWDIFTRQNHSPGWHNGMFIAVVEH